MGGKAVLRLNHCEKKVWLYQHLPNRVGALWVRLPVEDEEWRCKNVRELGPKDFKELDGNEVWCICRSVEHGRKAAIRWFIEFVGISLSLAGEPKRPNIFSENEVSIQSFVPEGINEDWRIELDLANRNSHAWVLARIWKACSVSSVHATDRTCHDPENPKALAEAFLIIVKHLQAKLYQRERLSLRDIVAAQK